MDALWALSPRYKVLALQEASGIDLVKLNEIANTKRLKDFNDASDREDTESGFTVGDTVETNSTVILTSKTADVDRGIFRSRIELAKCGVPDLIQGLMGQGVGTKVNAKLNGIDHEVELLAIRIPRPAAVDAEGTSTDAGSAEGSTSAADVTNQAEGTEVVGNA